MFKYIKDFFYVRRVIRILRKCGRMVISFFGEYIYLGGKVIFFKRMKWYDEFDEVIIFKSMKDMLMKFEIFREFYLDELFVWVDDSFSRFMYIFDENILLV